ncbi:MAG: hypothetical protein ACJARE_002177 [Paracoccaceae bacterium]|jgi:hypothetical protein
MLRTMVSIIAPSSKKTRPGRAAADHQRAGVPDAERSGGQPAAVVKLITVLASMSLRSTNVDLSAPSAFDRTSPISLAKKGAWLT